VTPSIPGNSLELLNPDGKMLVQRDACEKNDRKMLIPIEAKQFLRKEQATDMALSMQ